MNNPADPLRQCRRSSSCRAMIPESDLERSPAGKLVCKPGKCPENRKSQSDKVLTLELALRRAHGLLRDAKAGQDRARHTGITWAILQSHHRKQCGLSM